MNKLLMGLHLLIGFGALMGGLAAILNPQSPMGISPETLNGFFDNFLIPGLFLFIVIGLGNLLGFYLLKKTFGFANYYSFLMGIILVLWIVIQCLILKEVVFLHVLFFGLGSIQVIGNILVIKQQQIRLFK